MCECILHMWARRSIVKGHREFLARFNFPPNDDAKLNAIFHQRLNMSFQQIRKTERNSKSNELRNSHEWFRLKLFSLSYQIRNPAEPFHQWVALHIHIAIMYHVPRPTTQLPQCVYNWQIYCTLQTVEKPQMEKNIENKYRNRFTRAWNAHVFVTEEAFLCSPFFFLSAVFFVPFVPSHLLCL